MYRLVFVILLFASSAAADQPGFFSLTSDRLTAPFSPSGAVLLGFGAAGVLATENLEQPDETRFLELAPFEPVSDIGNGFGAGEFVLGSSLVVWSAGSLSGNDQFSALGRDLTATFVATGTWVWALKLAFDEPRPSGGPHSFPSGHTAVAFGSATVLHRHLGPRWGFLGYTLATMTAAARMEDRRHYMRDVTFGAALGMAVGGLRLPVGQWLRGFGVGARGVSYTREF